VDPAPDFAPPDTVVIMATLADVAHPTSELRVNRA
jgi:hypothetical protein